MSNLLTLTSCNNIRNKETCLCTSLSPDFPSGVMLWGEKEEVDVLSKTCYLFPSHFCDHFPDNKTCIFLYMLRLNMQRQIKICLHVRQVLFSCHQQCPSKPLFSRWRGNSGFHKPRSASMYFNRLIVRFWECISLLEDVIKHQLNTLKKLLTAPLSTMQIIKGPSLNEVLSNITSVIFRN